jgi:hypothetical protein
MEKLIQLIRYFLRFVDEEEVVFGLFYFLEGGVGEVSGEDDGGGVEAGAGGEEFVLASGCLVEADVDVDGFEGLVGQGFSEVLFEDDLFDALLEVGVNDLDVLQQLDVDIEDFLVVDVISAHLVEHLLHLDDVVDEVEHPETVVHNLQVLSMLSGGGRSVVLDECIALLVLVVLFDEIEGLLVGAHFFQVHHIEVDDTVLYVYFDLPGIGLCARRFL